MYWKVLFVSFLNCCKQMLLQDKNINPKRTHFMGRGAWTVGHALHWGITKNCCLLTLVDSSAPHSCFLTPKWDREKIRRVKMRNLVGWDKDSLLDKAKVAHVSKASQGLHPLLPICRQVFSHVQESRAPSHLSSQGRQTPTLWMSPSLFLPPALFAGDNIMWHGISSHGQLGSAAPLWSFPTSCASSLAGQCEKQKRSWILSLCSQHCSHHKTQTATCKLLWGKIIFFYLFSSLLA